MSRITTCPHCSTRLQLSEQITDKTLICPHCLADMDNPWPGSQIRAADIHIDVKRGLSVGCIALAVLIGLIGLDLVMVVTFPHLKATTRPLQPLVFAALVILVNIAIIRWLVRKRDLSAGSIVLAVLIALCVLGITVAFIASAFLFFTNAGKYEIYGPFVSLSLLFAALDVLVIIALIRGLVRWGISGVRDPSEGRVLGITFLSLGTIVAVVLFFYFTCILPISP